MQLMSRSCNRRLRSGSNAEPVFLFFSLSKINSFFPCFDIKCLRNVDVDPLFVDIRLVSGHKLHVANFGSLHRVAYFHTRDDRLDTVASSSSDDISTIAAVVVSCVDVVRLLRRFSSL